MPAVCFSFLVGGRTNSACCKEWADESLLPRSCDCLTSGKDYRCYGGESPCSTDHRLACLSRTAFCSLFCPQPITSFLAFPATLVSHEKVMIERRTSHVPAAYPTSISSCHVVPFPLLSSRGSSPPLFLSHPPPMPVLHMNSHPIWGALLRLVNG